MVTQVTPLFGLVARATGQFNHKAILFLMVLDRMNEINFFFLEKKLQKLKTGFKNPKLQ